VAVRADKFTFCDFLDYEPAAVATHKTTDLSDLRPPRKMVPRHCGVVKPLAAIGAGHLALQLAVPKEELLMSPTRLLDSEPTSALVVTRIVLATAGLAPSLVAAIASVKIVE
jgi:hypothetical protein